jgi:hypothetical protein
MVNKPKVFLKIAVEAYAILRIFDSPRCVNFERVIDGSEEE